MSAVNPSRSVASPSPPERSTSSTRRTSWSSAAGPAVCGAALGGGAGRRADHPRSSGTAASAATSPQVGVESFAWYRHEETVDSEGVGREIEERARAGAAPPGRVAVDQPGARRRAVQVRRRRPGRGGRASTRCSTACSSPRSSRTASLRGVITESKSGREAILAQRVVDATGDADVAARAGAPIRKTPPEEMLAVSVMFSMTGVNKRRVPRGGRGRPARPTATGPATPSGTSRPTARRTSSSRRSCASRSSKAVEAGLIPPDLITMAGTWGADARQGDLTYLNLVHLDGVDGDQRGRPDAAARSRAASRRCRRSRRSGAFSPAARTRRCATSG